MNTTIMTQNTLTISGISYPVFPRPSLSAWIEAAGAKGFEIVARIIDRLHLALKCRHCGAIHRSRLYTLMSAQPSCPSCMEADWRREASAAGLEYLCRDATDRHYAIYTAACGHQVRRQTGQITRIAVGEVALRCETCHAATEAAEAAMRDWVLTGPDPAQNPNYRVYRHSICGNSQRIARANMRSGRFACPNCDNGWAADPSYIYLMRFVLATSRPVIKLGYSRDPVSRLEHQLRIDPAMPREIIRQVAMPSGHAAIRTEKAMHGALKRAHPEAIIDPASWHGQIRVKTEIYDEALLPVILKMLADIDRGNSTMAA